LSIITQLLNVISVKSYGVLTVSENHIDNLFFTSYLQQTSPKSASEC